MGSHTDTGKQMSRHVPQKALTGTYLLVLYLPNWHDIDVGSLGTLTFERGYYLYIGSAFGPGGLDARIRRHLRRVKKHRWHIDYLSAEASIIETWFSNQSVKHECRWAKILEGVSDLGMPVIGFGSSDCSCASHLFYSKKKPILTHYRHRLSSGIKRWEPY